MACITTCAQCTSHYFVAWPIKPAAMYGGKSSKHRLPAFSTHIKLCNQFFPIIYPLNKTYPNTPRGHKYPSDNLGLEFSHELNIYFQWICSIAGYVDWPNHVHHQGRRTLNLCLGQQSCFLLRLARLQLRLPSNVTFIQIQLLLQQIVENWGW